MTTINDRRQCTETNCREAGSWVHRPDQTNDKHPSPWFPAHPTDTDRKCYRHGPGQPGTTIGKQTGPRRASTTPITPRTRIDSEIAATISLIEKLATIAPEIDAHTADLLGHLDGHTAILPGGQAPREEDEPVKPHTPPTGRCYHPVGERIVNEYDTTDIEVVDCGRLRPCPDHDTPITLTPTEAIAAQRHQIITRRNDWRDDVRAIAAVAHRLLADGQAIRGRETTIHETPTCPGYPQPTGCPNPSGYTWTANGDIILRKDRLCDQHGPAKDADDRYEASTRKRHARHA